MEIAENYKALRDQVFSLANSKIEGLDPTPEGLLAILMETTFPEATFSLLAVCDGTASIYFSNGGGIIGAGEHAPVRQQALKFVQAASANIKLAQKTQKCPLPEVEHTTFYFVTSHGTYTSGALERDFGDDKHQLSPLFHEGHNLIAAIRWVDDANSEK